MSIAAQHNTASLEIQPITFTPDREKAKYWEGFQFNGKESVKPFDYISHSDNLFLAALAPRIFSEEASPVLDRFPA